MSTDHRAGHVASIVASVVALVDASEPRCGSTKLIAIDGPSGAGKTTLASDVAAALSAPTVHMDDLYPGWGGLRAGTHRAHEWIVGPLCEGRPARYHRWDWAADAYAEEWVQIPPSEIVVVEGCGAGALPAGNAASVLVWVEADAGVRLARGIARDPDYAEFWDAWADSERRLYEADRTWERAHLFIDTTQDRL